MIREGDIVASGARLAVIDSSAETGTGNVGAVVAQVLQTEGSAARARAEAQLARLEVEREQAKIRLGKSEAELEQVQTQLKIQEQRLQLAQQEVERGESIAAKGFLAKREVDSRRLTALTTQQEMAGLQRQRAAIERDIADIKARQASIPLEIDASAVGCAERGGRAAAAHGRVRSPPLAIRDRAGRRSHRGRSSLHWADRYGRYA